MATTFIEPGGDADFGTGLWGSINSVPVVATDFVHGGHIKSIKYPAATQSYVLTAAGALADAGSRFSIYIYLNVLPNSTCTTISLTQSNGSTGTVQLRTTSGGILQLWNGSSAQIGADIMTLSTGQWYRISMAYTITSTTINRFEIFVDGVSKLSVTNATITNISTSILRIGNIGFNTTFDMRSSDHYIDNSNALTDPGNIWVTAKRPNANGTTNGFTTQIGAGGSGYGTGHSPQVNERPNDDTNGWSIITVASAITEEYNIESSSTGDIDISAATIVDYMGWVRTKALNAETAQIIVNNVNTNISVTTSIAFYTKIAGSATYPAGTGTDIGEISANIATTISLYECGIVVAYTPTVASAGVATGFMTTNTGFWGN